MLPKESPPWKMVYDHYHRWNQRHVWEAVLDELNGLHRKNRQSDDAELRGHRLAKRPNGWSQ